MKEAPLSHPSLLNAHKKLRLEQEEKLRELLKKMMHLKRMQKSRS